MAGEQIVQHRFPIAVLLVGFSPGAARARAEVLQHQIDVAIQTIERDNRRRLTHTLTSILPTPEIRPGFRDY